MKNKTILLVEDDYLDIKSLERLLKKNRIDHTLLVAHNGEDAIELLTNNENGTKVKPDIIILDINMPKMNGIEFLRVIKNYYAFQRIPIFITTTSSEEYDKLTAENLGIDGYIIKPFEFYDPAKTGHTSDSAKLLTELLIS
jgi:CheY-like chemotaxis protein